MIGAMAGKMIFLPNRKTMMMDLVQSRLENIIKSKVMKNKTTYQYRNLKMHKRGGNSVPGSFQNFSPNTGTCHIYYR